MNTCVFTGRITKDPEIKLKADGSGKYCYFCLAVDAGKNNKGEKQTEFIDCITYDKTAEFLGNYIKKGYLLAITGALHISLTEEADGNKTKRATVKVFTVDNLTPRQQNTTTAPTTPEPATSEPEPDLPFEI